MIRITDSSEQSNTSSFIVTISCTKFVRKSKFHLVSVYVLVQIESDGTSKLLDISNRGGRTFVGLGCILCGCKVSRSL